MKSEERIIELLAEYLQKTDQILDQMKRTDRSVEIMSRAIAEQNVKSNEHGARFNEMREEFQAEMKGMKNDFQDEMREMKNDFQVEMREMKKDFQIQMAEMKGDILSLRQDQGIMLKELVSLSKRVTIVEGKTR
ncbi:MAG: hypothetical protein ACKOC0_00785 [Cytophagales bacterium]